MQIAIVLCLSDLDGDLEKYRLKGDNGGARLAKSLFLNSR
jgi:hypothetical protein